MSSETNEQGGGEIRVVVDAAPEHTVPPPVTVINARGSEAEEEAEREPYRLEEEEYQEHLVEEGTYQEYRRKEKTKKRTKWMTLLATIAASVTYQAGLNPPGGFWQDNPSDGSHHAGDPVLSDEHRTQYLTFFYFNATAFVTSLMIIVMLISERFYHTEGKVAALMLTTLVDLASLIGAYIAGTMRYFSSTMYVVANTCVGFLGVFHLGELLSDFCIFIIIRFPCMDTLAAKTWCPIPSGLFQHARKERDDRKRSNAARE